MTGCCRGVACGCDCRGVAAGWGRGGGEAGSGNVFLGAECVPSDPLNIVPSEPGAGPAEVIEGGGGLICAQRLLVVLKRKTKMTIMPANKEMDFIFRLHLPV